MVAGKGEGTYLGEDSTGMEIGVPCVGWSRKSVRLEFLRTENGYQKGWAVPRTSWRLGAPPWQMMKCVLPILIKGPK